MSRDQLKTPAAENLLVHFKVASSDPETTRRVVALVNQQMAGQRVGDRGITVIVSDEDCEMSTTTKAAIANLITPIVAKALGVTVPT
jgi:hypothetical protein